MWDLKEILNKKKNKTNPLIIKIFKIKCQPRERHIYRNAIIWIWFNTVSKNIILAMIILKILIFVDKFLLCSLQEKLILYKENDDSLTLNCSIGNTQYNQDRYHNQVLSNISSSNIPSIYKHNF